MTRTAGATKDLRLGLQRRLLRAMLAMLAVAAAAGVIAIFLSPTAMGRVAATALAASVSLGIAVPISRLLDREQSRSGGLVGLGAVIVGFVCLLGAIWSEPFFPSIDLPFRLGATGALVLVAGLFGAFLLPRWHPPGLGAASRLMIAITAVSFVMFLIAIWVREIDGSLMFLESGWHIAGAGLAASICLVGLGARWRHWQWLGMLGALAQVVMGLLGVWVVHSDDPSAYIGAAALATVVAHANIVTRIPMGDSGVWVRMTAIGGLAACAACVTIVSAITGGFDRPGPGLLTRVAGACAIVGACGTVAALVMYRLHRRPPGARGSAGTISAVQVTCPGCAKRQLVPIGESPCEVCGLLIAVSVREPHCTKCDYLLLGIKGRVCPECGEVIAGRAAMQAEQD